MPKRLCSCRRTERSFWGENLRLTRNQVRRVVGGELGVRSTPLLVYWIIYQSDQLEEVGVYWKRDSKNPCIGREGVAFSRSPTKSGRFSESDTDLRSVLIKIALSFHPALPSQNSFIIKLHADTF